MPKTTLETRACLARTDNRQHHLLMTMTMASANTNIEQPNNLPPVPVTIPPHVAVERRSRRRRHSRLSRSSDQYRTLQILTILLIYIIIVHYALKFATFFMPHDDTRSKDEILGIREGNERVVAVVGSGRLGGRTAAVQGFSFVMPTSSSVKVVTNHYCYSTTVQAVTSCSALFGSKVHLPMHKLENTEIDFTDIRRETNNDVGGDGKLRNSNNNNSNIFHRQEEIIPSNTTTIYKRPRIPILSYQSSYVIVSKPAGMTVHANTYSHVRWGQSKKSPVLQSIVKKQLGRKVYLVHRLDHRTSGACILGFTSDMAGKLHGRLRDDNAIKLYVALVRGDLRARFQHAAAATTTTTSSTTTCTDDDCNNIGIDMSANGDGSVIGTRDHSIPSIMSTERKRMRMKSVGEEYNGKLTANLPITVDGVAKEACTEFYFLSSLPGIAVTGDNNHYAPSSVITSEGTPAPSNNVNTNNNNNNNNHTQPYYITTSLTLLLCRPKTGRTHQIRKHLQRALNAPIIGDVQHGDSRVNRYWRENIGLNRLGLHCWYLELPPSDDYINGIGTGEEGDDDDDKKFIECVAPLTRDFIDSLRHERLKSLWEDAISVEPRLSMESYDERGGSLGRHYCKRE